MTTRFPLFSPGYRFTDDTVPTVALADAILHDAAGGAVSIPIYKNTL